VVNFPNLFVSRTFSKAFGIANFRAGYLISDVNNIQQLSKIRNPKNFTTFAQEAVIVWPLNS
jgi:histidinol-phosphate aminotransferase